MIADRIKELRRVRAGDILANPSNYRTHPDEQRDVMQAVLERIGFAGALLARELDDGTLVLIDGHLRRDMDHEQIVPVLVTDLTEQEARELLAVYDPISAMAGQDDDILRDLLAKIEIEDGPLAEMLAAMDDELPDMLIECENDADFIPEPPVDPITKPGDLWILGEHRLLCGDSTKAEDVERLMDGETINVAFTSPPYASQRKYDESSGFKPIKPDDYCAWWEPIQANVKKHLAEDGSFFVNIKEHCEDGQRSLYVKDLTLAHVREWGWRFVDELIWTKSGVPGKWPNRFKNAWEPVFHYAGLETKFRPENVLVDSDRAFTQGGRGSPADVQGYEDALQGIEAKEGRARPSNAIQANYDSHGGGGIKHSAVFPVALPSFFIKAYSDERDTIYDPFLGSGTTLIAAQQLGRKCVGIEISPQYCDVIVNRWEQYTGETAHVEASK